MVDTEALAGVVRTFEPSSQGIDGLRRLTGGASQETWSFDALRGDAPPLGSILRRVAGGFDGTPDTDSR